MSDEAAVSFSSSKRKQGKKSARSTPKGRRVDPRRAQRCSPSSATPRAGGIC